MRYIQMVKRCVQTALVVGLIGAMIPASFAETQYRRVYDSQTGQYVYVPEDSFGTKARSTFQNPIVKQAAVGAAVGAAAGLFSDKSSTLRGAGIGALVGAGTGFMDRSQTLNNHPMAKTALKGAAIGTGASVLTRNSATKGALIGGAAGAGAHYLQNYLNGRSNNTNSNGYW